MATGLGRLTIDLVMRTMSFEQGVKRAQTGLNKFGTDVNRAFATADKAMLGMVGIAAGVGAAFTAMAVKTASAAKEIRQFSNLAGSTPREFQRMAVAANTVGIGQEKLADQLKDFQEKAGEFIRSGGGGMKDFFEQVAPQVGVTADQFRKLSGTEGLQAYYNALEKANLNQKEMSFYLESMASDSTALIPILRENGKELDRLADRAERFGFILDDQAVEQAALMSQTLGEMRIAIEGASRQMGLALIPAMQRGADYTLAFMESMMRTGEGESILQRLSAAAVDFVDEVAQGAAGILELGRVIVDLFKIIDNAGREFLKPFIGETRSATNFLKVSFAESVVATAKEIDKIAGIAGGIGAVWSAVASNIPVYFKRAWAQVLQAAAWFVTDLAKAINPLLQALGMEGIAAVRWGSDMAFEVESISDAFRRGREEAEASVNAYGRVKKSMDAIRVSADEARGALSAAFNGGSGAGAGAGADKGAADKAAKELQGLLDRLIPLQKINREFQEGQKLLNSALRSGAITIETYGQALSALNVEREKAIHDLIPEEVKRQQELSRTLGIGVADALRQADREIASMGMPARMQEIAEAISAVEDKYRQLRESMAASGRGATDPEIEMMDQAMQAELAILEQTYARKQELQDSWLFGMQSGMQAYVDSVGTTAEAVQELMGSAFSRVEESLFQLVTTGEMDLRGLIQGLAQDVIRMLIKMGVQMAVNFAMSKLFATTSAATAMATGSAMATAYAPAAALASLASFGSNAIPATAGILSTVGVAQGLSFAGMFDEGGNIPLGSFGIVGEIGPEIVEGPARITSRADTARLLNGNRGQTIVQVIENPSRAGETERFNDGEDEFVRVFVADINNNGPMFQSLSAATGLTRQGR